MGTSPPEPWETGQRDAFRGRFDADPDAYDRTRPVAPDAVFDDTMRLAGLRSGSTVLKIGPGTGQATRPLAEGGVRILALELGPHLAARARQNLGGFPSVTVGAISFEAWVPGDARPVAMQPAFRGQSRSASWPSDIRRAIRRANQHSVVTGRRLAPGRVSFGG